MNFLKKQGVAWVITIVMIVAAIGIGRGSFPNRPAATPETIPPVPSVTIPPAGGQQDASSYVYDDAGILSSGEEKELSQLVGEIYAKTGNVVACVTTNDGRSDIYDLALDYAEEIDLREYDFIIVVDMESQQYILVQGAGLTSVFTDSDCEKYADRYLLDDLNDGNYGDAFLSLTKALAEWYEDHYAG